MKRHESMSTTEPILLKIEDSNGKRIVTLTGEGPWIIGRDSTCEVEIADHRASRRHARLISTEQGLVIEDLASSNGTLLDGRSIEGRAPFPGRSTLKIGDVLIRSKKPTGNPPRNPGSDRPRRSATAKASSNSKTQKSQNAANQAPTPRTTRATRKEASPVGNLLLLVVTIGAIGYFISQLGPSPQELPPEIGVAAVHPAT
ncbi:MAG TPA: FHA domain-containing protein, partial [Planctomycetes bacterium]|nr:FHA domain-containing protein [Planctomycetota bacterium]